MIKVPTVLERRKAEKARKEQQQQAEEELEEKKKKGSSSTTSSRSSRTFYSLILIIGFTFRYSYHLYYLIIAEDEETSSFVASSEAAMAPAAAEAAIAPKAKNGGSPTTTTKPLFVTVLLPSVVNEKGVMKRLKAIQETWGPTARAIFVTTPSTTSALLSAAAGGGDGGDLSSSTLHQINNNNNDNQNNEYPQILALPSTLQENNVPRLKYVIEQIHQNVDPEFAFFVNDHTFVIPEHICEFLKDKTSTNDMYAGHALQTKQYVFNSGAAGYFLSRSTMKKIVSTWLDDEKHEYCGSSVDKKSKFLQKSPGLFLTSCLRNGLGIKAIDTRTTRKQQQQQQQQSNNGDKRYHIFHAFPFMRLITGNIDGWYKEKHSLETAAILQTDPSYATLLAGDDCCAAESITFHYVEDMETRAIHEVRKHLLSTTTTTSSKILSDPQLQEFMISIWPKNKKEFGGYNQGLPKPNKTEVWKDILKLMRKISNKDLQQTC